MPYKNTEDTAFFIMATAEIKSTAASAAIKSTITYCQNSLQALFVRAPFTRENLSKADNLG